MLSARKKPPEFGKFFTRKGVSKDVTVQPFLSVKYWSFLECCKRNQRLYGDEGNQQRQRNHKTGDQETREVRQRILKETFNFFCSCEVCDIPKDDIQKVVQNCYLFREEKKIRQEFKDDFWVSHKGSRVSRSGRTT